MRDVHALTAWRYKRSGPVPPSGEGLSPDTRCSGGCRPVFPAPFCDSTLPTRPRRHPERISRSFLQGARAAIGSVENAPLLQNNLQPGGCGSRSELENMSLRHRWESACLWTVIHIFPQSGLSGNGVLSFCLGHCLGSWIYGNDDSNAILFD